MEQPEKKAVGNSDLLARARTLYDVPQREPTVSEREFFKSRPEVAGMATDDNAVILNPYSTLKPEQKDAVLLNERARVYMRSSGSRPDFPLTPEQRTQFKDYSKDEQDIRETIAARAFSGDPSANATQEQKAWVAKNLVADKKAGMAATVGIRAGAAAGSGDLLARARKMAQDELEALREQPEKPVKRTLLTGFGRFNADIQ